MPFAEVDGVRLHYLDSGNGEPALVLLHAFPLHAGMWAPQLEHLSSARRVVAPDFLGFGGSDAPDSMYRYTMLGYADLVAGLLDRLGLDRVALCGLSMGGYVAFAFLRQYPERVSALILADTRAAADTTQVFERRTDQQDQVARIGTTALIETLLAGLLSDRTRAERLDLVEQVETVLGADVEVEQDHVRGLLLDQLARLGQRFGLVHDMAVELEVDPAEQAQRALVLDHEHGLDVRASPFAAHHGGHFSGSRIRSESMLVYFL